MKTIKLLSIALLATLAIGCQKEDPTIKKIYNYRYHLYFENNSTKSDYRENVVLSYISGEDDKEHFEDTFHCPAVCFYTSSPEGETYYDIEPVVSYETSYNTALAITFFNWENGVKDTIKSYFRGNDYVQCMIWKIEVNGDVIWDEKYIKVDEHDIPSQAIPKILRTTNANGTVTYSSIVDSGCHAEYPF